MSKPVTDKQIAFLKKLVQEKDLTGFETIVSTARRAWSDNQLTSGAASKVIDQLMSLPNLPSAPLAEIVEGMHKVGDDIFKVQRAVHGNGRLYAKKLSQDGDRWSFVYTPGAMYRLSASTKMSLEEAKAFGALYGTCCVCGRTLTNETSIEEGIGPVCSGRFDR